VPMYQNIIDPNLTAVPDPAAEHKPSPRARQDQQPAPPAVSHCWTATDFLLEEVHAPRRAFLNALQACALRHIGRCLPRDAVQLIFSLAPGGAGGGAGAALLSGVAHLAGPIAGLDPVGADRELHVAVEDVLTAAAPLLARLRRPALLLPGRVQAVVKAQRIFLGGGEEYAGVWHSDGMNENIVAVVNASPLLPCRARLLLSLTKYTFVRYNGGWTITFCCCRACGDSLSYSRFVLPRAF
jgi:hypothetical protein